MICIPINKKSTAEVLNRLKEAQELGDVVEIWFDSLEDFSMENLEKIFSKKTKKFLYKSTGDIEKLEKVMSFDVEYIDLDLDTEKTTIEKVKSNTELILSFHDFEKTPENLDEIIEEMNQKGADIVKIATFAKDFSDTIRMIDLLNKLSQKGRKSICISMGEEGRITRAAGHLLGNYLMYAPLQEEDKTAKGQILASELKEIKSWH